MRAVYLASVLLACLLICCGCEEEHETHREAAGSVTWREVDAAYGHLYVIVQQPLVLPASRPTQLWDLGDMTEPLRPMWATRVGSRLSRIIGTQERAIFTAEDYGVISRVDAEDGSIQWQTPRAEAGFLHNFAVSARYVYDLRFGDSSSLIALPIGTGRPVTRIEIGLKPLPQSAQFPAGPLVIGDSVVILDTTNSRLLAIRDAEGWPVVWEASRPDLQNAGPFIGRSGDNVVLSDDSGVHCIRAADGQSLWSHQIENATIANVTGSGETVYVITSGGQDGDKLLALSPDGELVWEYAAGKADDRPRRIDPIVLSRQDDVIIRTRFDPSDPPRADYALVALGKHSGRQVWETRLDADHPIFGTDNQIATGGDIVAAITKDRLVVRRGDGSVARFTDPSLIGGG